MKDSAIKSDNRSQSESINNKNLTGFAEYANPSSDDYTICQVKRVV